MRHRSILAAIVLMVLAAAPATAVAAAPTVAVEPATSAPAVAADYTEGGTPQSLVFYRSLSGGALYRTFVNNSWGPAFNLGGVIIGAPGAAGFWYTKARWQNELVARGTDNALWARSRVDFGGWGPWRRIGGKLSAAPAVTGGSGRIDYYVRGTDGALWTKRFSALSGWSGWVSLGGKLAPGNGPASVVQGNGHAVFVVGTDHQVWSRWSGTGSTWDPWVKTGDTPAGGAADTPAAVAHVGVQGSLVFIRGLRDNRLHVQFLCCGGDEWSDLGGVLSSGPGATALAPPTGDFLGVDVMGRGTDNALWARSLRGATWTAWKRW